MRKILSIVLSFGLLFQQSGLVYAVGELNLANYLSQARGAIVQPDQFRPPQLRYISYDIKSNDFKLLLDKGDPKLSNSINSLNSPNSSTPKLNDATQELFNYFLIGLSLPNDTFWVNLRPDAPENIIDPLLEKTDIGKIFLEADLQLKKDTASLTSPQNPEGKLYWDKLYKKAGELFGTENITIPTITRPWIVPNEVIVRETDDSAYIYKATLKVMLEEDYLTSRGGSRTAPTSDQYTFSDPRLKELNQYSTQLIRETILPKLTYEVNSSQRYAKLRQVYYSLVLSRWFKMKYKSKPGQYPELIDRQNLTNLASKQAWDKQTYFSQYQESFAKGEYNLKETVASVFGQSIRSYVSGGVHMTFGAIGADSPITGINVSDREDVTEALTGPPPATTASPLTQQQAIGILNNLIPENGDQLMLSEQTRQVMFETLINILLLTDKREELYDNTYRVVIDFMNGITNGKSVMKDIFASFGSELQKLKASNEPFEKKNVDKLFSVIRKLLLDNLRKSLPGEGKSINEKLIKLVQAKQSQPYFGLEQLEAVKYKDMLSAQLEALINELREHLSRYEKDYKFADGIRDKLLLSMGYINGEINKLRDTYYNELGKLLNDIINTLSNYREKYAKEKEISVKIPYAVGEWWDKESTDKHNNDRDNRIGFYGGLVDIFWNNEKSFKKTAGYIKMIIDAKKLAKDSAGSPLTLENEVKFILEIKKKLNKQHINTINEFSSLSLSDLKASVRTMANEIQPAGALALSEEASEWYDIEVRLSNIQNKVRENMQAYRKELADFYVEFGRNPFIKLDAKWKRNYADKYAPDIKATDDIDTIIKFAEHAYLLRETYLEEDAGIEFAREVTENKKDPTDALKDDVVLPLTPDESVNYVEEARGKLTNFYQWDSEKSSDATLDDLIEAAKKAGESKLKPNAMEVTSEAEGWYGLAEKLAEIKSEWFVDYSFAKLRTAYDNEEFFYDGEKAFTDLIDILSQVDKKAKLGKDQSELIDEIVRRIIEKHEKALVAQLEPVFVSLYREIYLKTANYDAEEPATIEEVLMVIAKRLRVNQEELESGKVGNHSIPSDQRESFLLLNQKFLAAVENAQEKIALQGNSSVGSPLTADDIIKIISDIFAMRGLRTANLLGMEYPAELPEEIRVSLKEYYSDPEDAVKFLRASKALGNVVKLKMGDHKTEEQIRTAIVYSIIAVGELMSYYHKIIPLDPELVSLIEGTLDKKVMGVRREFQDDEFNNAERLFNSYTTHPNKAGEILSEIIDRGNDIYVVKYKFMENEAESDSDSPEIGVSSAIGTQEAVPVVLKRGGIDFTDRAMRIKLERVGSFASFALVLPEINNVEALDLDKEYARIQAMVSSSIRPSDTRILEFAAACYYRGEFDRRLTQVSSCIKAAHLADECLGRESSPDLRLATMLPDALYGG